MSVCIQHCWLYGSIMRGSRNFRQGEGGQKKNLITFFRHQLYYSFKEGYQWFIYKQNYIFLRFQKGSNILQGGGGPNFSGGGGGGGAKC